jgi:hypothetical protein
MAAGRAEPVWNAMDKRRRAAGGPPSAFAQSMTARLGGCASSADPSHTDVSFAWCEARRSDGVAIMQLKRETTERATINSR